MQPFHREAPLADSAQMRGVSWWDRVRGAHGPRLRSGLGASLLHDPGRLRLWGGRAAECPAQVPDPPDWIGARGVGGCMTLRVDQQACGARGWGH